MKTGGIFPCEFDRLRDMIKAQILVVEDQTATADLILEVLGSEGYDVQTVDTLAKARARASKNPRRS